MLGPPKARDLDRPVLISLEAAVSIPHGHLPWDTSAKAIGLSAPPTPMRSR
jgi:hypothetical protein